MTNRLLLLLIVGLFAACSRTDPAKSTDMVWVPGGPFVMGSDRQDGEGLQQRYGLVKPLFLDEHPRHTREIGGFYLDKFEVTNAEYKAYVLSAHAREPFAWTQNGYNLHAERLRQTDLETLRWIGREYFKFDVDTSKLAAADLLRRMAERQAQFDRLPTSGVTWAEADQFCRARGKRLPTEAEWEKAARGPEGFEYPWGNDWDPQRINAGDDTEWEDGIAPVGSYEASKSPYGAYDMAGNVWEWVADNYAPYPGNTWKHPDFDQNRKVIRGGGGGVGHYSISVFFRAAARQAADPNSTGDDVGFRCAR